jgi:hypothetical protein
VVVVMMMMVSKIVVSSTHFGSILIAKSVMSSVQGLQVLFYFGALDDAQAAS